MPYGKFFEWIASVSIWHGGECTVGREEEVEQCRMPPNTMCLDFLQTSSFHRGASARAVQPCWGQLGFPPEAQTNPINSDGAWNKQGSVWFAQGSRTALSVLKPCEKFLRPLLHRRRELSWLFHICVLFFIDAFVLVWFGQVCKANYTEVSLLKGHFFIT